jgi:hypothetical protein
MTKALLCHGRLDIPFKNFGGHVPTQADYSNLPAIRTHWARFYECIRDGLSTEIELDEAVVPMWELNDEFYQTHAQDYDIVFVPHRQRVQFEHLGTDITDRMVFFMQTVFPERFTLDRLGWGANMSFLPMEIKECTDDKKTFFEKLKERIKDNVSKFEQPKSFPNHDIVHTSTGMYTPLDWKKINFHVTFICQLPHDETIKYHSDVSVADALTDVLIQSRDNGWNVLVKGHPVNPGSMEPLRKIANQFPGTAHWFGPENDISVHDALRVSDIICMVNSGVGFEAMLHSKPIFTYGRSEYQNVVNFNKPLDKVPANELHYASFLYDFLNEHTLDTTDYSQFTKILHRKLEL